MDHKTRQSTIVSKTSEAEFVALMAFLMSNVALTIDIILPALPAVGQFFSIQNPENLQLIILMVFVGLGSGELIFGTLSDSYGRRPIVYLGVIIFIFASLFIVWSPNFTLMLVGRFLQGIGLSATRSVSIAIIRDTYVGNHMARIMSFISTVFLLVPMVAPILGQIILRAFNWQAILYFQLIFIGVTLIWFIFRQVETLTKERRIKFSRHIFKNGLKEFLKHKQTVIYTIIVGLIEGPFFAYLGSSQHIFQEQYGMVDEFPYIFGGLALSMGLSTLLNGNLVMRLGMKKLVKTFLYVFTIGPLLFVLLFAAGGNPPLVFVIIFMAIQFSAIGFIFGNLSSLAMEPIGHIAGIGAAIFSFSSMITGVLLAIPIGKQLHTLTWPLFACFFLAGLLSIILISFGERISK